MTPPSPVNGIPFEPLWYNSYVTHNRNIITYTVIQQFISLGITQVKHLCEMKSYEPQFRSKRIFESLNITSVFFMLILRPTFDDALANASTILWISSAEWAISALSYAKSSSLTSIFVVFVFPLKCATVKRSSLWRDWM